MLPLIVIHYLSRKSRPRVKITIAMTSSYSIAFYIAIVSTSIAVFTDPYYT